MPENPLFSATETSIRQQPEEGPKPHPHNPPVDPPDPPEPDLQLTSSETAIAKVPFPAPPLPLPQHPHPQRRPKQPRTLSKSSQSCHLSLPSPHLSRHEGPALHLTRHGPSWLLTPPASHIYPTIHFPACATKHFMFHSFISTQIK